MVLYMGGLYRFFVPWVTKVVDQTKYDLLGSDAAKRMGIIQVGWGYEGGLPRNLAKLLLFDVTRSDDTVREYFESFCTQVIVPIRTTEWIVPQADIQHWLRDCYAVKEQVN